MPCKASGGRRPTALTPLLQIDQIDGWDVSTLDYLECGPALVELGDIAGYERFRQTAVAHVADAAYPFADRIIKISLLLPANEKILKPLDPLAEAAAKSFADNVNADNDVFLAAWRSVSLALMEYRRGNYTQAADWCRRCLAYPEYNAPREATARVILAMACQQLGQSDKARSELAQGREIIDSKFQSGLDRGTGVQGFWFDWLFGADSTGRSHHPDRRGTTSHSASVIIDFQQLVRSDAICSSGLVGFGMRMAHY